MSKKSRAKRLAEQQGIPYMKALRIITEQTENAENTADNATEQLVDLVMASSHPIQNHDTFVSDEGTVFTIDRDVAIDQYTLDVFKEGVDLNSDDPIYTIREADYTCFIPLTQGDEHWMVPVTGIADGFPKDYLCSNGTIQKCLYSLVLDERYPIPQFMQDDLDQINLTKWSHLFTTEQVMVALRGFDQTLEFMGDGFVEYRKPDYRDVVFDLMTYNVSGYPKDDQFTPLGTVISQ